MTKLSADNRDLASVDQKSGRMDVLQAAGDPKEEPFHRLVASEPQSSYSVGPHHAPGTMEELEAQGMNALQNMKRGPLSGAAAPRSSGLDLEVGDQIVSEGHEL